MSKTDKLGRVLALIQEHNNRVEDKSDAIDVGEFQRKLKKLGGTTEEALAECKWEDLESCGLPRILARKAAEIFRERAGYDPDSLSPKTISRMNVLHLLQKYNISEPGGDIAKELHSRSQGKKFIVLLKNGIDVLKSMELFNEIIVKRFPERDFVQVDGYDCRVISPLDGKSESFDESPIFIGRILRPDGTDDQLNRSWEGVPMRVRQLIRVAVLQGELKPNQEKAHDTLDIAIGVDAEKKLRARYKRSSVIFNELEESGDLPKLKVARSSSVSAIRNDPFYSNNKTY